MHRILSALVVVLGLAISPSTLMAQTPTTPARRGVPPPAKPAIPTTQAKPATPPARGTAPAAPATPAIKLPPGTYAHFATTNHGSFTAQLFTEDAPKTVENFVGLATGRKAWKDPRTGAMVHRAYYNNVLFHRVIPQFMIQGGDPVGTGTGGPGYNIPDEISAKYRFNKAGFLAMANTGRPNTGGGQFFITVAPYPSLDGHYTVFGEIVDGLANVIAISQVPRGGPEGSRPLTPVTLKTVTIETVK